MGGQGGSAVALVRIHVDNPYFANNAFGLKFARSNDNVVDNAEPTAMIVMGMMHASGKIEAEAVRLG